MRSSNEILQFINSRPLVILDGAMGTELERRGFQTTLPAWSASANTEAPQLVKAIHTEYIHAGADVITTNTFRTTSYTFEKLNRGVEAEGLFFRGIQLAIDAAKSNQVLIAGSIAPLEDCYRPDLVPSDQTLHAYHSTTIKWFLKSEVDFILLETMNNLAETHTLSELLVEHSIPFMVSFIPGGPNTLLSGEPLETAIKEITPYQPLAMLLNCRPPEELNRSLPHLCSSYSGWAGLYANGSGRFDPDLGWKWDEVTWEEHYLDYAKKWQQKGIKIIGGCCGTNASLIKKLRALLP